MGVKKGVTGFGFSRTGRPEKVEFRRFGERMKEARLAIGGDSGTGGVAEIGPGGSSACFSTLVRFSFCAVAVSGGTLAFAAFLLSKKAKEQ